MKPLVPLAAEAAGYLARCMADTPDRAMVEQLIRTRREGGRLPSMAVLPPLAKVAARILVGDGTDDAARFWTRQGIERLRIDAKQVRNTPLVRLCTSVLAGDEEAREHLAYLRSHGHEHPRGPLSAAERERVVSAGLDPDELNAAMLARLQGERDECPACRAEKLVTS